MSYSHLYPAAVLLPVLPSGPGLCEVCFTGLIRRVPYRLLSCIHSVPTIHVEPPIIGSHRPVILTYISQEVSAGQMVGPLMVQLRQHVHCSPIGLVPKGHNTGKWCMIVDLSHPGGRSVNDKIPKPFCSLRYPSIADATQFMRMLGPGTLLLKVDLKSTYRIVPVNPLDRHLLSLCWEDHAYIDQALPFGLRSAPILFTAVADAVTWALMQAGISFVMHYLDDYSFYPRITGKLLTAVTSTGHL